MESNKRKCIDLLNRYLAKSPDPKDRNRTCGAAILGLLMEFPNAFKNSHEVYFEEISINSKVSAARKYIESKQHSLIEEIQRELSDDKLPLEEKEIDCIWETALESFKNLVESNALRDITIGDSKTLIVQYLQQSFELISSKKFQNLRMSQQLSDSLGEAIFDQMTDVDNLSVEDLSSPLLYENLQAAILDLLTFYKEHANGPSRYSFIAEEFTVFLADYMKRLDKKVTLQIRSQMAELNENLSNAEAKICYLKDKLESRET